MNNRTIWARLAPDGHRRPCPIPDRHRAPLDPQVFGPTPVAAQPLFAHLADPGLPATRADEQSLVGPVIKFEVGPREQADPIHELIEDCKVQAWVLLRGESDQLIQWKPLRQLGQVDEVAWLGTCEDRQYLVGAELAQLQRRTVAGLDRIQGAIVDAEIDFALVPLAADSEADKRLPLSVPLDLQPLPLGGMLERICEAMHRRSVIRAAEVVEISRRPVEHAVGGHGSAAGETNPVDSGNAATRAATRSCRLLRATSGRRSHGGGGQERSCDSPAMPPCGAGPASRSMPCSPRAAAPARPTGRSVRRRR